MRIYFVSLILILFFVFPSKALAESPYVLPYPQTMPGSTWYKLDLIKEELMRYWYFGDFGQFEFALKESDKYLVEAKTLFEYKQYLLGSSALQKSDSYFKKAWPALIRAEKNGKNIEENKIILKNASEKHIEILNELKNKVPKEFNWTPEKSSPSNLKLGDSIIRSINIRAHL